MYNKKYQLVDIDSKNKGRQLYEEALNRICYPAYFVPGERGFFVCCFAYGTHTVKTSLVKNVEYDDNKIVVTTENTRYTFVEA